VEQGEGDGEGKTAGTGAAGVEVEDAVLFRGRGFVGVSEEDYVDLCGGWIQVEVVEAVEHVEEAAAEFEGLGCGKFGARAMEVDVAADGGYRGDLAEAVEDVRVADVAGVEDVLDTGECREGLWAEEAVGV